MDIFLLAAIVVVAVALAVTSVVKAFSEPRSYGKKRP